MRRSPMKRTGFARKNDGPRHISEILAEVIAPRLYRVPAPSAPIFRETPKQEIIRSENYRRFVASFACFQCGLVGSSQCAHANKGKGMAMKTSDSESFPLCFPCHADFDQNRGMTREERRAKEEVYVARMKEIAREHGRKEIA